jgi:hypothetical protein
MLDVGARSDAGSEKGIRGERIMSRGVSDLLAAAEENEKSLSGAIYMGGAQKKVSRDPSPVEGGGSHALGGGGISSSIAELMAAAEKNESKLQQARGSRGASPVQGLTSAFAERVTAAEKNESTLLAADRKKPPLGARESTSNGAGGVAGRPKTAPSPLVASAGGAAVKGKQTASTHPRASESASASASASSAKALPKPTPSASPSKVTPPRSRPNTAPAQHRAASTRTGSGSGSGKDEGGGGDKTRQGSGRRQSQEAKACGKTIRYSVYLAY